MPATSAGPGDVVPVAFRVWLGGALASQLGDAALYFALGWAASAHGGSAAGLVLSAMALPRTALLLFGGAFGDRWGARRVMITGDAVMLLVSLVLAAAAWAWGTPLPLLCGVAIIIGAVDAFYLPSSGSMPRRLVEEPSLGRAVAMRQTGSQVVTMVGGPIGGALVAAAGLAAAACVDAATFAVVLGVLIAIRSRFDVPSPARRKVGKDITDGVRVAIRTPGLGPALLLVAGAAGFIIPIGSLLVPLLARGHGWGAGSAGLVIGAQSVGTILVTLVVARRGVAQRAADAALTGLATAATGDVIIGCAPDVAAAIVGALVIGAGSGLFVSHLAPVLLGTAPRTHLARIQSLLSVVQSGALLLANNLLGAIAHATTTTTALMTCAGVLLAAAGIGCRSPAVRAINTAP